MFIDPATLEPAARYRLMISAIVPRPIAWVGTNDGTGDSTGDNLAPFSYFMGVSSDPPLLAISVARASWPRGQERAGSPPLKHTARNILATGFFSVSIPSQSDLQAMHATSAPWGGSEFEAVGIPRAAGVSVAAPRPAMAAFTFECRLHQAIDLGSTHLFVGLVVGMIAGDDVVVDGRVDLARLAPVARLGGDDYGRVDLACSIPRARAGG